MIVKLHRWPLTVLGIAAVGALSLSGENANALSLGRLSVLSTLGSPLRAEIDVSEINPEEEQSLSIKVASPETFVAAGVEYSAAIVGLKATLLRRPNGRAYIQLTGERSVSEPFVDMILVSTWSSGRIVRDYTMLFDPPSEKAAATAPNPTLPQTPSNIALPEKSSQPTPVLRPSAPETLLPRPIDAPVVATPTRVPLPPVPAKINRADASEITVKSGDTANKIAAQAKPNGVSLDQMLVALLQNNPDAFVQGNVNRLRAGSVLDIPSAEQAKTVAPDKAREMVLAQSKDFNAFRRALAGNAPRTALEAPGQKSSGTVSAKVEDKKPSSVVPDKLTLSKGALQSNADLSKSQEAKIAKERVDKESAARAAELAKNIEDLNKLALKKEADTAAAALAAAPKLAASASALPGLTVSVPIAALDMASAPQAAAASEPAAVPASAPASAAQPVGAASAVKPPVSAPKPMVAPIPVESTTLLDDLLQDPVTLGAAGGGLLALFGGLFFYRYRQKKKKMSAQESSFLESRMQPDSSFFGASGGQRVDTAEQDSVGGSSMVYSASQLEAADNVDAIAEADVYLAYGRDQQAEDILKEALRQSPERLAVYSKLVEIYAKRKDSESLKEFALRAFDLSGGKGPEWAEIVEHGMRLDPDDSLYHATPDSGDVPTRAQRPDNRASDGASGAATMQEVSIGVDLDLDLDTPPSAAASSAAAAKAVPPNTSGSVADLDFDTGFEPPPTTQGTQSSSSSSSSYANKKEDMIDFDMGSLSLDLESEVASTAQTLAANAQGPLETKLALAEEFVSIGDQDGARGLIEEVLSEAQGELRSKAQRLLSSLH